ncbi:hypothetical protein K501DRAFT_280952, partial [Backusella circina FSU 941]
MLPLPTATEIAMQTLMFDASIFLNNGKLKSSYELYIKALVTAVDELKQLEFIGQTYTCLRQAKEISNSKQKHTPPPIPPKPSSLSPTLPERPQPQRKAYSADMLRKISNPESRKPTINTYFKEDDDSEEGFSDDEREKAKKPYLEI